MTRLLATLVSATISALVCTAFTPPAAAQTDILRFGMIPSTTRNVGTLYLYLAQKKGFLAREGISLAFKTIGGGTDKMVAALDASTVDIAHTATPYLVAKALAGSDVVAFAGEVGNPVYSLIVRPEIGGYADLKGKVLGLSIPADTISISMRKLLANHGLARTDYTVKELVGTPVRFDCLKRGECAGVPLSQPNDFEAIKEGYRRLGLSTEAVGALQFQVIAVRRAFAAANKDKMVRLVRALAATFRFIHDPANRAEVTRSLVEHTGSSEEIAREVMALYFEPDRGVMPKQGEIDLKGLAQVIAFMGEGGALKAPLPPADRFVDLQYLHAAGVE
jgi:ABC-type nitrate/sulfonate/bicarbonate transport system substrate-binding protein